MFILHKSWRPLGLCWCSVIMTQMTCLSRQLSPVSSSLLMQPSVSFRWQRARQSQQRPVTWLESGFLTQVARCVEFWVPASLQMWSWRNRQSNSCGSDRLARALTATKSRDSKTSRQTESSLRAWPAHFASLAVSLCLSIFWFTTKYSVLPAYSQILLCVCVYIEREREWEKFVLFWHLMAMV